MRDVGETAGTVLWPKATGSLPTKCQDWRPIGRPIWLEWREIVIAKMFEQQVVLTACGIGSAAVLLQPPPPQRRKM
jgi:hypothetical protein